jgi:dihydroorotase
MSDRLFQQVRILDLVNGVEYRGDVLVSGEEVRALSIGDRESIADLPTESGQHLICAPGLVDLYSHSGEPGHEERETLASLLMAARAGGFAQINILPDTDPVLDRAGEIASLYQQYQRLRAEIPHCPQLGIWGAVSAGLAGKAMTESIEIGHTQVCGWSDGYAIASSQLIRRVLEYLQSETKPIALYACDRELRGSGIARAGVDALRLGLSVDPVSSEAAAVAGLVEIIADIGTPVHLMRISTRRGVEIIAAAKQRGLPITASTTWLHAIADTEDLSSYDPNLRLDPPLGTPADRQAIVAGIKTGTIDAIAIDHTPHTYEDKTVAFGEAPCGAIGLELALPLLWSQLIETGQLSAIELWSALSDRPTRCLGQDPVPSAILFDPTHEWVVDSISLHSRSQNTSWLGRTIRGKLYPTFRTSDFRTINS